MQNAKGILISIIAKNRNINIQREIDRKSEQLAVKDKQIEELNARLAEVSSALVSGRVFISTSLKTLEKSFMRW